MKLISAVVTLLAFSTCLAAGTTKLVCSFETDGDLSAWRSEAGAQLSLSDEHVTDGKRSLHVVFPEGRGVIRLGGPLDWRGWELLKIDMYNPGDPFTMTFRADDQDGNTISSWYHLIRHGSSTIDVHIRGLAERIDVSRIAWCHIRVAPTRPRPCEIYMDNWRVTRGVPTETWKPEVPPERAPVPDDPTNLITNPDFELGLQGWGSWGLWDGGQYRFGNGSGDNAYSGRHSLAIYCVKKGRGGVFTRPFSVPAAARYTLSVWAKGNSEGDILISYESKSHRKFQRGRVTTDWQKFSLSLDLPAGNVGRVYLYSRSGDTVYFDQVYFGAAGVRRPSRQLPAGEPPVVEVRGDKVYINGKPFFCRGIYRARPEDLRGTPFNFIPGWDAAQGYESASGNVWLMPDLSGLARAHMLYQAPQAIAQLKAHPRVIGWYVCDEPDHEKWPVGPDEIKYATQLLHRIDPGRVTMAVVMPWAASNLYRFADSVDILATDSYPIRKKKPSPVLRVAQAADWARRAVRNSKPIWLVVQGTAKATPGEEYAVTYLAITHGADGILYWEFDDAQRNEVIWKTILRIVSELQRLEEVLVSPDAPDQPQVSDDRIHVLAKAAPTGLYIITINSHHQPVTNVRIQVPGAKAGAIARDIFADRKIRIANGAIVDDFDAYERHVYFIAH